MAIYFFYSYSFKCYHFLMTIISGLEPFSILTHSPYHPPTSFLLKDVTIKGSAFIWSFRRIFLDFNQVSMACFFGTSCLLRTFATGNRTINY